MGVDVHEHLERLDRGESHGRVPVLEARGHGPHRGHVVPRREPRQRGDRGLAHAAARVLEPRRHRRNRRVPVGPNDLRPNKFRFSHCK